MKRTRRKIFIPVVAMSDIAFLLLIFLMVSSITTSQKSVRINLPQIEIAAKENIKKSINVFISKEGEYYIDAKKVDLENIADKLETVSAFNKNMVVFFYGDEETPYQYIDAVVKLLKETGLRNCIFVTRKYTATDKS